MGSSVSKLMMDNLDIPFESLSLLCPSTKLAAEEALPVEAGNSQDDMESFDEEDCLFVDRNEEREVHKGAFAHYSKALARPNSARPRPHSAHRDNEEDDVHEGAFSHYSRASASPISVRRQPNSSSRDNEEYEAYEGAFSHYSRASAKLNSGHPRPNSACSRSIFAHHEKENEVPCDINTGDRNDMHHMRLQTDNGHGCEPFASYDDRSLPLDIAPASPYTAAMRRSRRAKKNTLSVRESLLAEAWERKRELMLNEELANFKERAKPELLGRSSSDCGKLIADVQAPAELRRSRTRSLTDDDFEELRGCIDLGFRFDQSSIPDLCDTLPALEVYCAVAQNFQESPNCMSPVMRSPARCSSPSTASSWKISSPGDDPQDVKGRLRHWAQAVACDARLCY